jgi:hypothetical protein
MTDAQIRAATPPTIDRPGVEAVYLSHWHVPDARTGRAQLDRIAEAWRQATWPDGILTFTAYLSYDHNTALTYVQCSRSDVYRPFVHALPDESARIEPVEYRLRQTVSIQARTSPPEAVVAASFDVDGAERQRRVITLVTEHLRSASVEQHAGLLASHFHASLDGTRVINFAEWASAEAHIAFLEGPMRHGALRLATETPGVRPIGFTRYHLYRSLTP